MKMTIKFPHLKWTDLTKMISFLAIPFFLLMTSCNKDNSENLLNDTALCLVEIDGKFEEIELDEQPKYLDGGDEGFTTAFGMNVIYPAEARENGIEGICVVNYEITEEGTVENIEAIQDPGGRIGESATETIGLITEGVSFSPGILNNNPVRVKKELEIRYKLE